MKPWKMYKKGGVAYQEGGSVKPWEQYSGGSAPAEEAPAKPKKESFMSRVLSGTAKALNTRPEQVSGSLLDGGIKVREKTEEEKKLPQTSAAKRASRTAGVLQGALGDTALAVAQMLPNEKANQWAKDTNTGYEQFRKDLGNEGFDGARLFGNVVSPVGIKGANLIDKGYKAWGKGTSLVRRGATQGAFAGAMQPVLPTGNEEIDPDTGEPEEGFWGEKAKQVGTGALFGGALNKLLAPTASKFSNPSQLPATPSQLASQAKVPMDKVGQYRQMFPEADLTWGQQIGPRANEWEQRAQSLPFIGDVIRNAREKALRSQNVSMMNKALEPAGVKLNKGAQAGRGMFDEAYEKLGSKYDNLLDKASLHDPVKLRNQIFGTMDNGVYTPGAISDDYARLSEAGKKRFDDLIEKGLFQKFGKDPQGNHSVRMTGRKFKEHEESLKNTIDDYMNGVGEDRTIGRMLKNSLSEAYQNLQGATPEVSKELKNINKAYAQFKTLEKASTASAQSGGVFNPLQTIKAATQNNRAQVSRGKGLLQPEAELSQDVLGRVVPDSGTAGRLMQGNPFTSLLSGAASLPLELLYSPKFTSMVTQGGTRAKNAFGNTRLGGMTQRNAKDLVPSLSRYMTQYGATPVEEEEEFARGGLAQYAGGGDVQWSDIQGQEQALPDPREIAYGQKPEDVLFVDQFSPLWQPNKEVYPYGSRKLQYVRDEPVMDGDTPSNPTLQRAMPFNKKAPRIIAGEKAIPQLADNELGQFRTGSSMMNPQLRRGLGPLPSIQSSEILVRDPKDMSTLVHESQHALDAAGRFGAPTGTKSDNFREYATHPDEYLARLNESAFNAPAGQEDAVIKQYLYGNKPDRFNVRASDVRHRARGGMAYADGGEVQWSDIQGQEKPLTDPREVAYGQPLEDTSFIGAASKLFRPKLQRYAEKMEKAGKTPEEIWNKTMTARLPKSGEWAQEIADTPQNFGLNGVWDKQWRHLEKNVKAPDLFDAYPDLRKQFGRNNPDMRAYASHSWRPDVMDSAQDMHLFDMNLKKMQDANYDPNSSLLHEIQHYIQSKEGWPMGGGQNEGALMAAKMGKGKPALSADDQAQLQRQIDIMKQQQSEVAGMGRHKGQAQKIREISKEINKAEDFLNTYKNQLTVDPKTAHEFYRRLGGEAQARLTQNRMGLSAKERKQHYPFKASTPDAPYGMDIKPEDIITTGYGPNFAEGGEVEPSLMDTLASMRSSLGNPQHWKELGQGTARATKSIPSVAESLGRGAVASIPGVVGDVSQLGRMLSPSLDRALGRRYAPTTEELLQKMPRMTAPTAGAEDFEMMGGLLSPAGVAGKTSATKLLANRRPMGLKRP